MAITRLMAGILILVVGLGRVFAGDSACFVFLAVLNALCLLLAWALVVETKGVSIEHAKYLFDDA
eukprot:CAMPEP_0172867744 /NCGR_PEP_ID=MMETSP1075-20121228/84472_1 /TAXON_ID=2916 /ORGANISM="Ceratium fusus, Strain PA161109" /LENGTH=64 /DNA_ID=CAMNT_0013717185 /DNA_START=67 /DNA_END=257 /DNA_ORIENTATION=-